MFTLTMDEKERDLLVAYCDLAIKQTGLNGAEPALALARKLLTAPKAEA